MKTLYIISKGMGKQSNQVIRQLEIEDKIPRVSLLEDAISAEVLDERYLTEKPPRLRRLLYRLLPVSIAQLIEALFILNRYDLVLTHTEKVSLPLALILKWFRSSKPHIVVLSRITSVDSKKTKQKIWFFKKTAKSVTAFLIWSSVQRRIAIERFGVPPDKIILLKRGIDQLFWSPREVETDMICSVGMEARDYPTLVDALRPLKIPCHIAAGASRGDIFKTIERLHEIRDIPDGVTVGPKKPIDLRTLYARSRFTVIPLIPTDSDNGLTTILESMAMGKPVICTKAEGQIDIIQDGITGIYVPQGDSGAMRDAIQFLWDDPERCEKMGKAARAFIEKRHNMEQFVAAIKNEVDRSVGLESTHNQSASSTIKSVTPSMHKETIELESEKY
ncbi:MAG: glycosyltransferase family 4 protein [Balneolaceae bacterium]